MNETVNLRKLLWPAPLAVLAAAGVNLVWYFVAGRLFPESVSAAKVAVNEFSIVFATIVYWVFGLILFAVVARFSKRPLTHFKWLAIMALVVSFVFPFGAAQGTLPGGSTFDLTMIVVLMGMHIIAAGVGLPLILKWVLE